MVSADSKFFKPDQRIKSLFVFYFSCLPPPVIFILLSPWLFKKSFKPGLRTKESILSFALWKILEVTQGWWVKRCATDSQKPSHMWRCKSESHIRSFFPSRVSGRGYKISPVCPSVCVSVCHSALSRLNCLTYGPKIWWRDWPWRMSVLEGLWGKNTDKDTSREGASTLRRFH